MSSEGWSHLCHCGGDRRLAMAESSSLFVPVTLVPLHGLKVLVAGVSLLTVIRHLRVGETCGWGSQEECCGTTQECD